MFSLLHCFGHLMLLYLINVDAEPRHVRYRGTMRGRRQIGDKESHF